MKVFVAAMGLAGLGLLTPQTWADTGNDLYPKCQAYISEPTPPAKYFDSGVCAGYIRGMVDGIQIAKVISPDKVTICFPDHGFTNLQGVKVVQRYLDNHPESLNEDESMLTLKAFRAAFPCK